MARWLLDHGFPRVAVLRGGLDGWRRAGLATEPFVRDEPSPAEAGASSAGPLLPSLAERLLGEGGLPTRVRLATLFVDIAGSTRLLAHHPPETVLVCVQRFMRLVAEVALAYCGDVKDFEGDGALLYFEAASEAVEAALAIRAALADGLCDPCPISARMSVAVGDVVLGVVGSRLRHTVALVGPEMPDLRQKFQMLDPAFEVPATGGMVVATWALEPTAPEGAAMR